MACESSLADLEAAHGVCLGCHQPSLFGPFSLFEVALLLGHAMLPKGRMIFHLMLPNIL